MHFRSFTALAKSFDIVDIFARASLSITFTAQNVIKNYYYLLLINKKGSTMRYLTKIHCTISFSLEFYNT